MRRESRVMQEDKFLISWNSESSINIMMQRQVDGKFTANLGYMIRFQS